MKNTYSAAATWTETWDTHDEKKTTLCAIWERIWEKGPIGNFSQI